MNNKKRKTNDKAMIDTAKTGLKFTSFCHQLNFYYQNDYSIHHQLVIFVKMFMVFYEFDHSLSSHVALKQRQIDVQLLQHHLMETATIIHIANSEVAIMQAQQKAIHEKNHLVHQIQKCAIVIYQQLFIIYTFITKIFILIHFPFLVYKSC